MNAHKLFATLAIMVSINQLNAMEALFDYTVNNEAQKALDDGMLTLASNGKCCAALQLITCGANVNAQDRTGDTLLHYICGKKNSVVLADVLMRGGINVNVPNNKHETPLHIVSQQGWAEGVKLLLAQKADVHARTLSCDNTPLDSVLQAPHLAESARCVVAAKLLIAGADPNKQSRSGGYPLLLAASQGWRLVVAVLLKFEAHPMMTNALGKRYQELYPEKTRIKIALEKGNELLERSEASLANIESLLANKE